MRAIGYPQMNAAAQHRDMEKNDISSSPCDCSVLNNASIPWAGQVVTNMLTFFKHVVVRALFYKRYHQDKHARQLELVESR